MRALAKRFGITDPAAIVIVHDELDLPPGTVRLKAGGGLAGHNGLRSISVAPPLVGLPPGAHRRGQAAERGPGRVPRAAAAARRRSATLLAAVGADGGGRGRAHRGRRHRRRHGCGATRCPPRPIADDLRPPDPRASPPRRQPGRRPPPAAHRPAWSACSWARPTPPSPSPRRRRRWWPPRWRRSPSGPRSWWSPPPASTPSAWVTTSPACWRAEGDAEAGGVVGALAGPGRRPAGLGDPALRAGEPRDRDDGPAPRRAPRADRRAGPRRCPRRPG